MFTQYCECFKLLNLDEQVQQLSQISSSSGSLREEIACLSFKRNFKSPAMRSILGLYLGTRVSKHSSQSAKKVSFSLQLNVYCIGLCEKIMFFANDLSSFIRLWVPTSWKLGPYWVPKSFSDGSQASVTGPLDWRFSIGEIILLRGRFTLAWECEGRTLAWLSSAVSFTIGH